MKKSYFFLFVSVTSYKYIQTIYTSSPYWTVANFTPNNVLNFTTEITLDPNVFSRITERVRKKMVRVNKTNGVFVRSYNEYIQKITVFDLLGRKRYDFQSINLISFRTNKFIAQM